MINTEILWLKSTLKFNVFNALLKEVQGETTVILNFFVHTIWTTINLSIIMVVITINVIGFTLLPCVFLGRTPVFS